MNSQVHCRLMRLTVARVGIKQRLGQLIPSPVANYYHKWRSADESWKRTRFMVLCSTYMVVYFTYHMAYWSCLPPRVEMPPVDGEDGIGWKPETIASFSQTQWYEWDHLTRSPLSMIPLVPNKYRDYVARTKFNAAFKDFPDGWRRLYAQVSEWFGEMSRPEFGLPDLATGEPSPITVSFELSCLIDAEYDCNEGWKFKLRRGAKYFINKLAAADCELVLYTNKQHADLQVFAEILDQKTNHLLDLRHGANIRSIGVNYKLYRNSCTYRNLHWNKHLPGLSFSQL